MNEPEINLLSTMDGALWAKEFCRITGFQDEEWAFVWFANALMCGWDHHHWSTPEYKARMREMLGTRPTPPPSSPEETR